MGRSEERVIPQKDRRKLFDLRCRSKRGEYLSPEDVEFCSRMFRRYPGDYKRMSKEVFEATKPFGAL